ncbi:hypothetical protein [Hydrogenimonas cancrithermarum]|uniref:Uncharacterized protein n=1 Tax=Hydrogenimonas cancrithermarum TaxID=2993563 RepID=A0ABM8FPP8_9BACT|nr:hypothetical protein [Hydrogenimonas cancrithermarum]BDY14021.1 hypothetical protein HCR_23340 [Hydrogenimonas cancrithermarum]
MQIAVRGEGPTDMGRNNGGVFQEGPMVTIIRNLACYHNLIEWCFGGVKEGVVTFKLIEKGEIENSKEERKKMVVRGAKERGMLTKKFFRHAEAFASIAKMMEADMAIFFTDADKESWEERYRSIKEGLKLGGFEKTGVPMVPNKISEAWLLCCDNPAQNCVKLESLPTGDESHPKNPKRMIKDMGKDPYQIASECDPNLIDMPSFNRFRDDFTDAVNAYCNWMICE